MTTSSSYHSPHLTPPPSDHDEQVENTASSTHETEPRHEHPILEIIRFSIIALIIVVPIRMFIAQPFIVSGASMEETFSHNQYLIVDQLSYHLQEPKRGDVVIFRYPQDPSKFFIKRVIGVPGDTVTVENSTITITNDAYEDGLVLDEPYIRSMTTNSFTEETLGDREYFVLGDNRDESSDSRVWGVLQEEHIIGRALLRLFPPNTIDFMPGAHALPDAERRRTE